MTPDEISLAERMGYKWYWVVNGITECRGRKLFTWKLRLAFPPEDGIGKHWIGQAGETRAATNGDIAYAKSTSDFEFYGDLFTRSVPAENFLGTVEANVDNEKLTDAQFREFIRNSLSIVQYIRPAFNAAPSQPPAVKE